MKSSVDIAVIGSGFGGSLMALVARRLGRSVLLLERGRHPRFAIGESSTPMANLLLEELCRRYDLRGIAPLAKWGTWQQWHPELACGLKRGFSFYHHAVGQPWRERKDRQNQLLVAASPEDRIADTHWFRQDVDAFLVREARSGGAEYWDEFQLDHVLPSSSGVELSGSRAGTRHTIRARMVVDASGPRGVIARALNLPEVPFRNLPPTQALYTHFRAVRPLREVCPLSGIPPFPVDDAAVHHVFEDGWIWVLQFNNGITSAGAAVTDKLARAMKLEDGEGAWNRLLRRLPGVQAQFRGSEAVRPFRHVAKLSYRSARIVGERWALLPSAAGFIDPLLSTGFPLTLMGVFRLGKLLEDQWDNPGPSLDTYAEQTGDELDAVEALIAALYGSMKDVELFNTLALLYFAAASFTETAWRLGRRGLCGPLFLLAGHDQFGPACREICHAVAGISGAVDRDKVIRRIRKVIAPFDVAGLGDASRRNWFPVNLDDLLRAASKLNASTDEIHAALPNGARLSPAAARETITRSQAPRMGSGRSMRRRDF